MGGGITNVFSPTKCREWSGRLDKLPTLISLERRGVER